MGICENCGKQIFLAYVNGEKKVCDSYSKELDDFGLPNLHTCIHITINDLEK